MAAPAAGRHGGAGCAAAGRAGGGGGRRLDPLFFCSLHANFFWMYIFLFLPFDKFLSVKIFLVIFFTSPICFLKFFLPTKFSLEKLFVSKKCLNFFSQKTTKKFLKTEKIAFGKSTVQTPYGQP